MVGSAGGPERVLPCHRDRVSRSEGRRAGGGSVCSHSGTQEEDATREPRSVTSVGQALQRQAPAENPLWCRTHQREPSWGPSPVLGEVRVCWHLRSASLAQCRRAGERSLQRARETGAEVQQRRLPWSCDELDVKGNAPGLGGMDGSQGPWDSQEQDDGVSRDLGTGLP
ncbi:PREDICTED: uncharacterized protein LOC106146770 isoform X2 [Chinchilla lanigera]|uniref:uncharacterized protein LOC106146770 isoform X2 n=1 Tax=Chinchilla lanigera TaxID=34839 RepID=UPI000696D04B|nr:PREDICTED: uncharacterized protein LOC106146770 isoform X2 [Chinchilla lanigera]